MHLTPTILVLTPLLPVTIASPSPSIVSRDLTCIDGDNNPAPCTCSCSRADYLTNVDPPYSEGKAFNCAIPDVAIIGAIAGFLGDVAPYGPVGCLSCQPFTGSDYDGAIPCDSHGECQFQFR